MFLLVQESRVLEYVIGVSLSSQPNLNVQEKPDSVFLVSSSLKPDLMLGRIMMALADT